MSSKALTPGRGTVQRQPGTAPAVSLWARWLMPSLADIVFLSVVAFILVFLDSGLIDSDGDLARHLLIGRQILSDHSLPMVDLWSHTAAGKPFVPFEWLSEVVLAWTYQVAGLPGVIALAAVIVALPFLLITRWAIRSGADPAVTLVLAMVGAMAASIHWLARPHLFSILIALLWTRALYRHRETGRARYLFLLPPMMVLWVNLHGGFLAGFVILAVFLGAPLLARLWTTRQPDPAGDCSGPRVRKQAIAVAAAGMASVAAAGINPAGFSIWPHMLGYFQLRYMLDNTTEHMSPNFHQLSPQLFIALALLGLVSLAWRSRRADPVELGLVAVWTAFAIFSARHIPMFVAICTPLVARAASDVLRELVPRGLLSALIPVERRIGGPVVPVLGIVVACLLYSGAVGGHNPPREFSSASFPAEAIAAADRMELHGRLFNHFTWGGYILLATYPRYPIFIDGETELYGDQITRDYASVVRLEPTWETVLDRYEIGWTLIPHQSPLSLMLRRSSGWKLAHEDKTADIFTRVGEASGEAVGSGATGG